MKTQIESLVVKAHSLRRRVRTLAESEGEWKTINGRHVLVGKGETPLEALNKSKGSSAKPDRTHLVSVRVQDPTLVASGAKDIFKKIRVTASDDAEAMKKAEAFYKKQGFKNIHPFLAEKIVKANPKDKDFDRFKALPNHTTVSRSDRGVVEVLHEGGVLRYLGRTKGGTNVGTSDSLSGAQRQVQDHYLRDVQGNPAGVRGIGSAERDIPWRDIKIK